MNQATKRVLLLLAGGLGLAALQQQLLLRRPPRLLELQAFSASSGPAALDLRFSRPMLRASLERDSALKPPLAWRWLGEGNPLRLLLRPGQTIPGPLTLLLAGVDRRNLPLPRQRWRWDPRPRLLAVVPVPGGEQLQLQRRDGSWQPLTPVWPQLAQVMPLGNGSGVALLSGNDQGSHQLWLLPLQQRNLVRAPQTLSEPRPGQLQPLSSAPLLFAHLSSNQRGDLLVQSATAALDPGSTVLRRVQGGEVAIPQSATGPMQLLPEGGGLVVPELEGLTLHNLPGQPSRRQVLPGSRELSSFCPVSGRALLVRHWPDYRRSLELVEPGQPPRQLWIGGEAVLASACDRGGERVWLVVSDWARGSHPQLLALDRRGQLLQQRPLTGWEVEPGAPLLFDPSSQQLLLTLRSRARATEAAQPVLIEATTLELRPQAKPVRLALWLPAG
ncbi:hypothetical protein KBY65_12215 [Cyanobium sp. Alchichica 3B3-8F6]|uniref:hypothetical protein n=1 Tax=Cyanobium sp. Alchichica 3B3-8F6 TaxID=2823696 RepID=UPI0020CC3509|nr:hypothetical protein [Cyanobium sp. Alchichica 3B3-8F6]MCP9883227.1 hypothetical protein [Cyanobium sp. Alchichica 3B3-8F6]